MEGWIKLHRKITRWEWFKTPNMYHLFSYMLLSANNKDNSWQGITVMKGQLVSGVKSLSENTGISAQSIRTCINKLKSTGEITIQSTNRYSIITICNYESYQLYNIDVNNQINNQVNKQLTNNQQTTNNKQEYNNKKKDKNILKEEDSEEEIFDEENPEEIPVTVYNEERWLNQKKVPMDEKTRKWLGLTEDEAK